MAPSAQGMPNARVLRTKDNVIRHPPGPVRGPNFCRMKSRMILKRWIDSVAKLARHPFTREKFFLWPAIA